MNTHDKYDPENTPPESPASTSTYTCGQENKPLPATANSGKCGQECEVYSRVCGYFRPVKNWNKGKREEFNQRKLYKHVDKKD